MIKSEAFARICFFGDHQDYLNLPVISGTIDRKITLTATPNSEDKYILHLLDLDSVIVININENFNNIESEDYFRSSLSILQQAGLVFEQGYTLEITGNIPVNAGVSSSSALVVAWIRFLVQAQKTPVPVSSTQIGQWAYAAEVGFFNQPGGLMDQYTIAQEGLLYIDTYTGSTSRLKPHLGQLVVAESGIAKETLTVLHNAREYGQKAIEAVQQVNPNFELYTAEPKDYALYLDIVPKVYQRHWYAAVHNYDLTLKAMNALQSAPTDLFQIGKWMNEHQHILQDYIQNTPKAMALQMEAARNAGALGAKIIGSGGGGCMLALVTEKTKQKVIDSFLSNGAVAAYEIQLTSPL